MADVGDVTGSRALGKAFATLMPQSSELDLNSSNTGYQKFVHPDPWSHKLERS